MDADEREIYNYLKPSGFVFLSEREIARRAGGKMRFRDDPRWATPVLTRMVERSIIESDSAGHYRLKPMPKKDNKGKRWVSPQVAKILKESGRDFSNSIVTEMTDDEYYNSL